MSRLYWILDGHTPVACDLMTWTERCELNRPVAETLQGDVCVSTVFLGEDHNSGFGRDKRPVLFETMVLICGERGDVDRYCTWDEAVEGHRRMVQKVFKAMPIVAMPQ